MSAHTTLLKIDSAQPCSGSARKQGCPNLPAALNNASAQRPTSLGAAIYDRYGLASRRRCTVCKLVDDGIISWQVGMFLLNLTSY